MCVDFNVEFFWKWTRFRDYCMFLAMFVVATSLVTFLLLRVSLYVELLGLASLMMEAGLGLPQLWKNHSNKSTEGMRWGINRVLIIGTCNNLKFLSMTPNCPIMPCRVD